MPNNAPVRGLFKIGKKVDVPVSKIKSKIITKKSPHEMKKQEGRMRHEERSRKKDSAFVLKNSLK